MTSPSTLERSAPATSSGSLRALPWLFTFTAFFGASLLFVVQPLVAKILLPSYGGAATVWATSSLFFQTVLLGGYLLVHGTTRLGPRRQPLVHLPLVLLALLALPLALPSDAAVEDGSPILWLLRTLLLMIGLPFAVLTTTGPLLQKWYSWTSAPRHQDPYFLYAASNVGSFVGLLAYPFLIEPSLSLATQKALWTWAFVAFLVLITACSLLAQRHSTWAPPLKASGRRERIPLKRQAYWVGLAFVPSSLMLGVTTHISTDVAAIPLLWVIPLAIYLATMVAAFASTSRTVRPVVTYFAVLFAAISLSVSILGPALGVVGVAGALFFMLALVAYACHAHLAADRPEAEHLTYFYVLVSVGGALGGLLNGMVAPVVFSGPFEFELVLSTVPLLLIAVGGRRLVAGLAALTLLGTSLGVEALRSADRVEQTRTFYGSYIVKASPDSSSLIHGTTVHGQQILRDGLEDEPTTYYAKTGPLGELFAQREFSTVAAVGLGIGTLAAYSTPGDEYRFVEIDPAVTELAQNEDYFTYLARAKGEVEVLTGDGRLMLEDFENGSQELIVLDAFSSDSIPVHLLTEEAFAMYAKKLTEDGVLMVHISNRVFDLAPVVASHAATLGFHAVGGQNAEDELATASTWIALTKDGGLAETLENLPKWGNANHERQVRWTDDYSSILDVLMR